MSTVELHKLLNFIGYTLACYMTLLATIHDSLWIALINPVTQMVSQLHWLAWIDTTIQIEKPISIVVYLMICAVTPFYAWYSVSRFKRHGRFYHSLHAMFLISMLCIAVALFIDSYWLTTINVIAEMLLAIKAMFFLFLLVLPSTTP